MKLADFETLEQAKAHPEKRGVILNANDMGVLFDKHPGTLAALEAVESQNESVKIFLTLFRSGGGRYDFREKPTDIEEVTDGEQLKTKMQQLVEAGVVSAAFANDVFIAANPVYYPHRPQVFADIQGVKQRITGFGLVNKAGDYLAQVPRGYSVFYVDDAYGVIA